jgi:hypothetical protein
MNRFTRIWNKKPLQTIIIIALILRLIAVIFSRGYVVHYDHFDVIETAQAWVDGTTSEDWIPDDEGKVEAKPKGVSFTYVGLHYLLFQAFEAIGIMNAGSKMLVIRFLHALFSLLVVSYAYRITHLVSNKDLARYVGLLIATFWLLPFVSVHNMAEFFTVPFLMLAIWFMVRPQYKEKPKKWALFSGLVLGTAFSIWFFNFLFVIGYFIVLILRKRWPSLILSFLGFTVTFALFQGLIDYQIWGKPFVEVTTFFKNLDIPFTRPGDTIFSMYAVLLLLVLIPPISIFWLIGWVRSYKTNLLLFLPAFLMFIFFSFSNQQHERFIMAVFPFIVISGVIGWDKYLTKSVFWNNRPGLYRSMVIVFWAINFILLIPFTAMYSKRSQVESMLYLQQKKRITENILIEDSNRESARSMPLFYMEKWVNMYKLPKYKEYEELEITRNSNWEYVISTPSYFQSDSAQIPDYVLFVGRERLDERVQRLQPFLPELKYKKTIKSGIIDRLLYKLNPKYNVNLNIYIYQVQKV